MYNYHTHPNTCPHADGTFEQYINEAIKNNFDGLGFSDHIFLKDIKNSRIRGDFELTNYYLTTLKELKEKYQDKIEIYIGFECEWLPKYKEYYSELLESQKVDYLIFGNHAIYIKGKQEKFLSTKNNSRYLSWYLNKAVNALNSGLFKIMAHPDLFMIYTKWNKKCEKISRIICLEAKKNNVALELNMGKINGGKLENYFGEIRYGYPYYKFWEIAKEVGNTIVIGYDAHSPIAFSLTRNKDEVNEFINKLNLSITSKLDIK